MIRPLTCLSLVAALGAGLYLYQEKHRAQLLDRDIGRTVKLAEQARDRIGLLKAEWALLNEPERLAGLATQHLQLQALQPAQFVRLEDLRTRLPAILAEPVSPTSMDTAPLAAATPSVAARPQMAMAQAPVSPLVVPAPAASPKPLSASPASPIQLTAMRPAAAPVAAPRPVPHPAPAKPRDVEVARAPERTQEPEPMRRLFAPVMPAYAPTPVVMHAPTVQQASATAPQSSFVGSALGMARSALAAPVPVASATVLGSAVGR